MKIRIPKTKNIAAAVAGFVIFACTLIALAQSRTDNPVFTDADQDGLTDSEEKAIGTNPKNPDSDGDGYRDGEELKSGYNPLKPAPGDKIIINVPSSNPQTGKVAGSDIVLTSVDENSEDLEMNEIASSLNSLASANVIDDLESDPNNPNLTNELIAQLLSKAADKGEESDEFIKNPQFTQQDIDEIASSALENATDITKGLPEIKDEEIKILPEIKANGLSQEELESKQKAEIEKYLAQCAFVAVSNSPFSTESEEELKRDLMAEQENLLSAISTGNQKKVDEYAEKAKTAIEQMKQIEVPFVLKDVHKAALSLSIYTLGLKDLVSINPNDPLKSLMALSSLQLVAVEAVKIQEAMMTILKEYNINSVSVSPSS